MEYMKTKEAAHSLGVSATTVKRWASSFPDRFHKDSSGHYVFSPEDMEVIRFIRDRLEVGAAMKEIELQDAKSARAEAGASGQPEAAAALESSAALAEAGTTIESAISAPPWDNATTADAVKNKASDSQSDAALPAPVTPVWTMPEGSGKAGTAFAIWEELRGQLESVEHRLSRKAGDVVNLQILEHRRELEEIRSSIHELACTLDAVTQSLKDLQDNQTSNLDPALQSPRSQMAQKKSKLRMLLHL